MNDAVSIAPTRRGYLELALRRLKADGPLTPADEAAVRALNAPRRKAAKGEILAGPGAGRLHLLLEGWAGRARSLGDGRRQIFDLLMPGDALGEGAADDPASHYVALTPVVTIAAEALTDERHPAIAAALAAGRRAAHGRLLDHVVRLGAHNAYERLAHLLIELYDRQAQIGMADGGRLVFPLGQERLGEVLGLSAVHVNRTLTALKKAGRLTAGPGWLALPQLRALAEEIGYPADPHWPS